jgi:hypothetical protein
MLTTEYAPTAGDALINNLSVVRDQTDIKRRIGYCPQFDALNPTLTSAEHIEFYGKLRGLKGKQLAESVNRIIKRMDLERFRYNINWETSFNHILETYPPASTLVETSVSSQLPSRSLVIPTLSSLTNQQLVSIQKREDSFGMLFFRWYEMGKES